MAYQVLARKWRPHNFTEIVGQNHVVQSLINALQHQRLHHAYLFTGTRGVGKTTIARILAKAINCENLQDYNPCGVCDICTAVDQGSFLDLIEVDAASRTKVEDTRELLDNAQYAPNRGRYKVYLIDEVHMLSGHSFNALLKTLEEPPEHVKFLLATTDPHKIPVTVLSRCLQFNLKRLRPTEISTQMEFILGQEQINFEPQALKLLARAADGSLRDGLSLLDQAIVFGNGSVAQDIVQTMLGTIAQEPVDQILQALARQDAETLLGKVSEIADLNPDFASLVADMLQLLHRIALFQVVPQAFTDDDDTLVISELAKLIPPEDVQLYYQIALLGQKDLDLAPDPRLGFEMLLLRMLAFKPVNKITTPPTSRIKPATPSDSQPSQVPTPKPVIKAESIVQAPTPAATITSEPATTKISTVIASDIVYTKDGWPDMIQAMKLEGMTRQLANNCILETIDHNACTLLVDLGHQHLCGGVPEEKLKTALQKLLGNAVKITLKISQNTLETPAVAEHKAREDRQQAAVDAINRDPNVQALKEQFDARIMPGTIEPL